MTGRRIIALGHGLAVAGWLCTVLVGHVVAAAAPQAQPEGEMRWALYVTLSPAWFDPTEVVVAGITPFWVLYAMQDALVKPCPATPWPPAWRNPGR